MAWTSSACPRGLFGLARPFHRGEKGGAGRPLLYGNRPTTLTWLQLAALVHLLLLAVLPNTFEPAGPLLTIVTGTIVVVLTLLLDLTQGHHVRSGLDDEQDRPRQPRPEPATLYGRVLATIASSQITLDRPRRNVPSFYHRQHLSSPAWPALMTRVSHELRTPLNAVIGFSDLMSRGLFGPLGDPRYHQYACHIRDSGAQLLKSAEDTLALASLLAEPPDRTSAAPIVLNRLVADAWDCLAEAARGKGIHFTLACEDGLEVLGDRIVLRQILVNLMSEAVSLAIDGGSVHLAFAAKGERVELHLSAQGCQTRTRTDTLALCVARTILDLQDSVLIENRGEAGIWHARAKLDRASQQDFFRGVPQPVGEPSLLR